jgi:hypothetical protein
LASIGGSPKQPVESTLVVQRICSILVVASGLLLLLTLAVTVRSFFATDLLDIPLHGFQLNLEMHAAQLKININDDWLPQTWGWRSGPADYTYLAKDFRHGFFGLAGQGSQGVGATRGWYYGYHFVIPAWIAIPMLAAAIWLLASASVSLRQRLRAAQGLCVHCGYDLRAHAPGSRCPECGLVRATAARGRDGAGV